MALARLLAFWLVERGLDAEAEAVLRRALAEARACATGEEQAEQAAALRSALVDPRYDPARWRELILADLALLRRRRRRSRGRMWRRRSKAAEEERTCNTLVALLRLSWNCSFNSF